MNILILEIVGGHQGQLLLFSYMEFVIRAITCNVGLHTGATQLAHNLKSQYNFNIMSGTGTIIATYPLSTVPHPCYNIQYIAWRDGMGKQYSVGQILLLQFF